MCNWYCTLRKENVTRNVCKLRKITSIEKLRVLRYMVGSSSVINTWHHGRGLIVTVRGGKQQCDKHVASRAWFDISFLTTFQVHKSYADVTAENTILAFKQAFTTELSSFASNSKFDRGRKVPP